MPTTSDTIPQAIYLESIGGVAAVYATKAAFLAAGWALTWQDKLGVALTSQPTWTLSAGTTDGRHVIGYTFPAGAWSCRVTWPSGYRSDPAEFDGFGTTYDEDDIVGILAATTGEVITEVTTSGSVDLYEGNSIIINLSVLETALSFIGAASLAAVDTISAKIKLDADASGTAAEVTLTAAILTDISGARVVQATLDTFPAALALGSARTLDCRCDLLLTKGTKKVTAAVRDVTVLWKANP